MEYKFKYGLKELELLIRFEKEDKKTIIGTVYGTKAIKSN